MTMTRAPLIASATPSRASLSNYVRLFAPRAKGRVERPLGEFFGLKRLRVHHTTLAPGAASMIRRRSSKQDQFIFVLEGEVVLVNQRHEWTMSAGWCVGLPAGAAKHRLENRSSRPAILLAVDGKAVRDDEGYSLDELLSDVEGGTWHFTRNIGRRY
jgi:uncharacterized cupin superfamily protein